MGRIVHDLMKTDEWEEVDEELGEYLSPIEIINRQGGFAHPIAVQRGENIIRTCLTLGGKFMSYNWQAKDWDLLMLKRQYRETYRKQWPNKQA